MPEDDASSAACGDPLPDSVDVHSPGVPDEWTTYKHRRAVPRCSPPPGEAARSDASGGSYKTATVSGTVTNPDPGAMPGDDPAPSPPPRPDPEDCCRSACNPCIFELYEEALERYRAELKMWQEREARKASG